MTHQLKKIVVFTIIFFLSIAFLTQFLQDPFLIFLFSLILAYFGSKIFIKNNKVENDFQNINIVIEVEKEKKRDLRCNEVLEKEPTMLINFYFTNKTCPYCNYYFKNPPKRKKRCPKCKNFIYKRTLYPYGEDILLKEEDIPLHKISVDEYSLKNDIRRRLKASFKDKIDKGVCIEDALKSLFYSSRYKAVKAYQEHKIKVNFGPYRNAISYLGYWEFLNGRLEKAIRLFFQVLYLDFNDNIKPENRLFIEYWVILCVKNAKVIGVDIETQENIFIEENIENYKLLKENGYKEVETPENVWNYLKDYLAEYKAKLKY